MARPFPFFEHGLGVPSNDFQFCAVFDDEPDAKARRSIAKRLGPFGKPTWTGPFACWTVNAREIKAGLASDPSFEDDPTLLSDPAVGAALDLDITTLRPLRQRLAWYTRHRDELLTQVHTDHPIAMVVGVLGPRAHRSSWHRESLASADDCLARLALRYRSEPLQALVGVKHYRRRNYYTSPAKPMLDLVVALRRATKDPANDVRARWSEAARAALGMSSITDHQLMSIRYQLVGTSIDEQLEDIPEPLRAKLKLTRGWSVPLDLW